MTSNSAAPRLLEGIRVVDLSSIWAAPLGTRWLADMGAEVLKVTEVPKLTPAAITRLKRLREQREAAASGTKPPGAAAGPPAAGGALTTNPAAAERGFTGYVLQTEGGKKTISLDFELPKGRELLVRLIEKADILVDNHRPIVLERCGLDIEGARKIKPDIIVMRVSAMGATGPERNYSAFGATIDGLGGLAFHTGYHDRDEPVRSGINYADPIAGMYVGGAVMQALIHRHRTGQGQEIDLSLRETLPIGEMFMEYSMNRRFWPRIGNREPGVGPHGVYRCAGDDRWIAIAVTTDGDWRSLRAAMGEPDWAADSCFATPYDRWMNHDALDAHMAAWTRAHDNIGLAEKLQAAGVAATPVLTPPQTLASPHMAARGWWHIQPEPNIGDYHYYGPGWRLSATPAELGHPPAAYGAHNREILQGRLGLDEDQYQALIAEQVVSESALPTLPPDA